MLIEILGSGRLQCVALDSRPEAMSTSSVKNLPTLEFELRRNKVNQPPTI